MLPRVLVALVGLALLPLVLAPTGSAVRAQDGQLPAELQPRTVTLKEDEIPLSRALKELARQTGNEVVDRRKTKDDPRVGLDLKKATFWQALDAIAQEADARVSLYEQDRKIALVDGPFLALPTSYSGLFRTSFKRIDAVKILEPEAHYCVLHLEVAWEPRFQPFLLETLPDSLAVQDDKGTTLAVSEMQKGQIPVGRQNAREVEMRLPAPRRAATRFGQVKGSLAMVGPTKMLAVTFAKLGKIEKRNEVRKETVDEVTVHLRKFLLEGNEGDQLWTAEVLLEYPEGGPNFESFQSWLVNNEAYLEHGETKQRFPANAGFNTEDQSANKALLQYRFTDEPDKNLLLGKPASWNLVYRTPGKIVEVPIPFEFKDLPLP